MAVSGNELASLNFGNLIGGPLNAIVEAQAKAALTTADFIKQVGFDKNGDAVNVDFSYFRKDEKNQDQEFTLSVPFLTMLPIPYIALTEGEIMFNAKITSTTEKKESSDLGVDASVSVGANAWFASAKLEAKTSYQKKSSINDKEERSFDMRVFVKVKGMDMPAGTERLLGMLEQSVSEVAGPTVFSTKVLNVQGNVITLKDGKTLRQMIDKRGNVEPTFTLSDAQGKPERWTLAQQKGPSSNDFQIDKPGDVLAAGSAITIELNPQASSKPGAAPGGANAQNP